MNTPPWGLGEYGHLQADPQAAALDRLGAAVLVLAEESRLGRQDRARRAWLHLALLLAVAVMVAGIGGLAYQHHQIKKHLDGARCAVDIHERSAT